MAGSGEVTTYGQLAARSQQLAHHLREVGLQHGDHITVMMENHPAFFEVVWAALDSGLYVTPVNRHLSPEEAEYVIGDCEAKAVVTSAGLVDVVAAIDWSALPEVRARLVVGGPLEGFDDYDTTLAAQPSEPIADRSRGATMLYTSGTTGRPKGVLRPLPGGHPDDPDPGAERFAGTFDLDSDTVYLSPAPLYHAAPLAFCLNVHRLGGAVVVMERFDAASALAAIERHRVTHSQWVPTMFIRMLALPADERAARDLSSHRVAIHAAAPCPVQVKHRMIEWWGPILLEYYAGTDSGGMTLISSHDWLDHPGSVGRGPVRIVDDEGADVPHGEVGNVYFVGSPDFVYKGDEGKTAASRLPGGLSTMGDCGYLDQDGWLYLTDRKDFMIISGGVNIYPREIEDVLLSHQSVADAAVIGIPHPEFGEEVKATVELVPGTVARPELIDELAALCRRRLASFKVPRSIDVVDSLPRTPTGKLLKRVLRERYL